jgi:hypothetical protein
LEVYGVDDTTGKTKVVKFDKGTADADGEYAWVQSETDGQDPVEVAKRDLAASEIKATIDLNGDGAVGFKKIDDATVAQLKSPKGWMFDKADVGLVTKSGDTTTVTTTASDTAIYIVANSLTNLKKVGSDATTNAVTNAALMESATKYWAPEPDYTVTSINVSDSGDTVNVWAEKTHTPSDNADANEYLKYEFKQTDGQWVATSVTAADIKVSSADLVTAEWAAHQDLNGDQKFGLILDTAPTSGVVQAHIDDQTYLFVSGSTATKAGTAANPLTAATAGTVMLQTSDSTDDAIKAWKPTGSLSEWTDLSKLIDNTVEPLKSADADAKFAVKDGADWVYFKADGTNVAAAS